MIKHCGGCPLATSGLDWDENFETDRKFRWVIVGEAPGKDEEDTGRPFVGEAGRLLRKHLTGLGININDVYFTNVLLCRPPRNKIERYKNAVKLCHSRLALELERHTNQNSIVLALGAYAWRALGSIYGLPGGAISKVRGSIYNI